MSSWTFAIDAQGIGRLTVDVADAKVNTFSTPMMADFLQAMDAVEKAADSMKALVLSSGKAKTFIAGADIKELQAISSRAEALDKARQGQQAFDRLAALSVPTIAVINGPCLGGGMECALACDWRLAVNHPATKLGLPEVKLGIMPGWGGTQRLPRLIGLDKALPLIVAGRMLDAKRASKQGLVDALLAPGLEDQGIQRFLESLPRKRRPAVQGLQRRLLMNNPAGRALFFSQALKAVRKESKGLYPAPLAVVDVLRRSHGSRIDVGLQLEAEAFADLAIGQISKTLVHLFFSNEKTKKIGGPAPADEASIDRCAVLGAGIMGGGIAWLCADKDKNVRLRDLAWEPIAKAMQTAKDNYSFLLKRKKLKPAEVDRRLLHIGAALDYRSFDDRQLVIEAVIEKLSIKRDVLAEVEHQVGRDCILASNTSSLRIADMASALQHPDRFLGLHFFNPVNRMPLVEVVPGPDTDPTYVGRLVRFARACGKTPIVVGDCPGFLVNRILLPYMNEAAQLLQDGAAIGDVDTVLSAFGMPMGPCRLADEVGLDVGYKVAKILHEGYGDRMLVAPLLQNLAEDRQLLGRKGGAGFYRYQGRKTTVNPDLVDLMTGAQRHIDAEEIRDRCLLLMVNEAYRCLEEGIVDDPDHLDLAMLMGTGFPPCHGGPIHYAEHRGLPQIRDRLLELTDQIGERFAPCDALVHQAQNTHGKGNHGNLHVPPAA